MVLTNIDTIKELLTASAICLPLVVGLTEVVKRAFNVPSRFIPALAVILGAVAGILVIQATALGAVAGVIIGLGASGLWDFGNKTIGGNA